MNVLLFSTDHKWISDLATGEGGEGDLSGIERVTLTCNYIMLMAELECMDPLIKKVVIIDQISVDAHLHEFLRVSILEFTGRSGSVLLLDRNLALKLVNLPEEEKVSWLSTVDQSTCQTMLA